MLPTSTLPAVQGFAPEGRPPDLWSDVASFFCFIWEELKPFPGRGHALVRVVTAVVATTLICQTLRIPNPAIAAYLVFFVVNEEGINSLKLGLISIAANTVVIAVCLGVTICFMDTPWFRLPLTFALILGAMLLSRTLVLGIVGKLLGIILVFYLSLADFISDPEELTESTLWLWSVVAIPCGVAALTSFLLEPRSDLLFRAQLQASLAAVERILAMIAAGQTPSAREATALRRLVYSHPQRTRQLLARWHRQAGASDSRTVDWEMAITVVERLLAATATLGPLRIPVTDPKVQAIAKELSRCVGQLKTAVEKRDTSLIRSLTLPSADALRDSAGKAVAAEMISALADARLVLVPYVRSEEIVPDPKSVPPKPGIFLPDAFTNPDHLRFAYKVTLAIFACEIFINAVDWPGIRTALVTCVVTALATSGAQRQKQLLRITGVCIGGVMGLVSVVYLIPCMDSIVGLSILVAGAAAACAWVGGGSVRISYAGFQMALAFFLLVLPGFETNIDLTGIRDRFVGILVGITAMWFIFDCLWYTPSGNQVLNRLTSILRVMAKAPVFSPRKPIDEVRLEATAFRRQLLGALEAGRASVDETKIDLSLTMEPHRATGGYLEDLAGRISLAGLLLLTLNESKLRILHSGAPDSQLAAMEALDEGLSQKFTEIADEISAPDASLSADKTNLTASTWDRPSIGQDLVPLYEGIYHCIEKIPDVRKVMAGI